MPDAWIISDLHLGDGGALEDFRDDDLLVQWLDALPDGSTLVLNGDVIEFLQIGPPIGRDRRRHGVLWDEATSLAKLQACMRAHPAVFDALARFVARAGDLRVTIGNHDLDLGWAEVQAAFVSRVGDAAIALRHTVCDTVHVEHGHRFTVENRPRTFDDFLPDVEIDGARVPMLEACWGSTFVVDVLNQLEGTRPRVDAIKPMLAVASDVFRNPADYGVSRGRLLVELLRTFARFRITRMEGVLLTPTPTVDTAMLTAMFADDQAEWVALVRDVLEADPVGVEEALDELDEEDREAIAAARDVVIGSSPRLLPPSTLGWSAHFDRERRGARALLDGGASHVVLGHTHDVVEGALDGRLWNPGSWVEQVDLDRAAPEVRRRLRTLGDVMACDDVFVTDPVAVHVACGADGPEVSLERIGGSAAG